MVRNQGMAYKSGMKPISSRWLNRTGSWNACSCENLAKYSWMTAALSFRNMLCRYLGMKADRQAQASDSSLKLR